MCCNSVFWRNSGEFPVKFWKSVLNNRKPTTTKKTRPPRTVRSFLPACRREGCRSSYLGRCIWTSQHNFTPGLQAFRSPSDVYSCRWRSFLTARRKEILLLLPLAVRKRTLVFPYPWPFAGCSFSQPSCRKPWLHAFQSACSSSSHHVCFVSLGRSPK